jgi:hypothetical protein
LCVHHDNVSYLDVVFPGDLATLFNPPGFVAALVARLESLPLLEEYAEIPADTQYAVQLFAGSVVAGITMSNWRARAPLIRAVREGDLRLTWPPGTPEQTGSFSATAGPCPAGHVSDTGLLPDCEICAVSSYANELQTDCEPCPTGFHTDSEASTSVEACHMDKPSNLSGKKSSRNTINIVAIVCTSALLATLIGLLVFKHKKNRAVRLISPGAHADHVLTSYVNPEFVREPSQAWTVGGPPESATTDAFSNPYFGLDPSMPRSAQPRPRPPAALPAMDVTAPGAMPEDIRDHGGSIHGSGVRKRAVVLDNDEEDELPPSYEDHLPPKSAAAMSKEQEAAAEAAAATSAAGVAFPSLPPPAYTATSHPPRIRPPTTLPPIQSRRAPLPEHGDVEAQRDNIDGRDDRDRTDPGEAGVHDTGHGSSRGRGKDEDEEDASMV